MKDNKNFKSTFDIIKEISAVWEDLDDITQANVSNLLGGKRNANVIQALMTNFKDAEAAMQTASNAAGSALKENEQYLDSIQGKLDIMKGKFQELAMQIIGSNLVKWVADVGNGTLDIVNSIQRAHALLPLVLGAITTIVLSVAKLKAMAGEHNILAMLGGGLGAMTPLAAGIMGVSIAIAGVVAAVNHFSQAQQKAIEQADQAASAYADNEAEYSRNIATLDSLSDRYHELKNSTQLTAEEQEEYRSILQQIIDISPTIVSGYDNEHDAILKYKDAITGAKEELAKFHAEEQKGYFAKTEDNWDTWSGELDKNQGDFKTTFKATMYDFYQEAQQAAEDVFGDNSFMDTFSKIFGAFDESNYSHGWPEFDAWLNNLTYEEMAHFSEHMDDYVAKVIDQFGTNIPVELMSAWRHNIVESLQSSLDDVDDPLDKMTQHLQAWVKNQEDLKEEWAQGLSDMPNYQSFLDSISDLVVPDSYGKSEAAIKEQAAHFKEMVASEYSQALETALEQVKNGDITQEQYSDILDEASLFLGFNFADTVGTEGIQSFIDYYRQAGLALVEVGDDAEETAKTVLDLSKAIEKMAANDKILQSAKEEMLTGGLSTDTVKSIQDSLNADEKLSSYLYTENGLIKLNTEAWEERNRTISEGQIADAAKELADAEAALADADAFGMEEAEANVEKARANLELMQAIFAKQKTGEENPLDLSKMFGDLSGFKSNADTVVGIIENIQDGALQDWQDMVTQFPELMKMPFDTSTLEGQEKAMLQLLSSYEQQYDSTIQNQIDLFTQYRQTLEEQGSDTSVVDILLENLGKLKKFNFSELIGKGTEAPMTTLKDSMEKASKYADTLKSSMDGIDFGEWQQLREVFGEDWQSYLAPDGKSLNSAKMYTEIINELIAKGASKEVLDSFREMWFAIGGDGNADKAVEGIEHLTTAMDELAGANELLKGLRSGKGNPIDYIDQLLELAKGGHIDIASIFGTDGKIDFASASSAVQTYMDSLLSWSSVQAMNIPGMTEEITAALREQVLAANEAEQSVTTLKDAISGINTANGFLSNIRAYEKTGEGDVLSMITQAAELAEREGFKINDFFTIVGDNVQWNSDAVVRWAQSWISSIDGIDGVTEEFLNKQIQAMSQAERMSAALSEATTITQVGYTAGPSSQITYDQYQELIGISKQYAYAVEYNNGILTLNKAVFDDVTDSIIANKLAEIEAAKQAVIMGDEYQRLIKDINAGKTLSDDDRQLFTNLNADIMGFEVLKQQIEGATAAYQKFLNADSATDSTQYEAGQKALQVIKDTLSNPKSDAYGKIGRQEYKEAVKFLIDPEIEVNSAEWNAQMKQLGRWFTDGDNGIKQFWTDLQSNGFIDSNNQLTGSVEAMAESLGTNVNVVCALLDQLSLYLEEPIKQENGEIFDSKSILEAKDALDQAGTAAKNTSENVGDVSTEAEEASTNLETIGQKIEDAKSAIDELATKEVTMDTSSAATKLGQLSTSLVKIMNQVNKLASKTVNIKVNYSTSGGVPRYTAVSGYGYSAAPGTLGAPGGRTLVGELGEEIIVDPNTNTWYTVGEHGAMFTDVPPGAIIFNAEQTRQLLSSGHINGRAGSAMAAGNAAVTSVSGGGTPGWEIVKGISKTTSSSASSPTTKKATKKSSEKQLDKILDKYKALNEETEHLIEHQEQLYKQAERGYDFTSMDRTLTTQAQYYQKIINDTQTGINKLLKKGATDSDKQVQELEKILWDAENNLYETLDDIHKLYVDALNDRIDNNQSAYGNLSKAAEEMNGDGLTIDTWQTLLEGGVQYLGLLDKVDGQYVVNTEALNAMVAAEKEQLAIETALSYIDSMRVALAKGETEAVNNLVEAKYDLSRSSRDMVKNAARELKSQLSEEQYERFIKNLENLFGATDQVITDLTEKTAEEAVNMLDEINKRIDDMQSSYSTLTQAIEDYNNYGEIQVDTFQQLASQGLQYMSVLEMQDGQYVINTEAVENYIAAEKERLAVEQALDYIDKVKAAVAEGNIAALMGLTSATNTLTGSTWAAVSAELALLAASGIDKDSFVAVVDNINKFRNIAASTGGHISRVSRASASTANSAASTSDSYQETKDAMDDILEATKDLIKYETEQRIDAIEEEIDGFKEIIKLKKESLRATKDEDDYQKGVAKKTKEIARIQAKIDQLSLDDSREARAERNKLTEELNDLQEDLSEYQVDHSIEAQEKKLDEMAEAYEKARKQEITALEESIGSTEKLYQAAINRIDTSWDSLYQDLINWNYEAGNRIQSDLVNAWDNATSAIKTYGNWVEAYKNVELNVHVNSSSSSSSGGGYSGGDIDFGGFSGIPIDTDTDQLPDGAEIWYNTNVKPLEEEIKQYMTKYAQAITDAGKKAMFDSLVSSLADIKNDSGLNTARGTFSSLKNLVGAGNGNTQGGQDTPVEEKPSVTPVEEKPIETPVVQEEQVKAVRIKGNTDNPSSYWYYSKASASESNRVSTAKSGELYEYLGESGNYFKIKTSKNGRISYIKKDNITGGTTRMVGRSQLKYHTGGVVGDAGSLNDREVLAILEKGEMVLTDKMKSGVYQLIDFTKELAQRLGSALYNVDLMPRAARSMVPAISGAGGDNIGGQFVFNPNIEVNIQGVGTMSREVASTFGKQVADSTLSEFYDAFQKRGMGNIFGTKLKK